MDTTNTGLVEGQTPGGSPAGADPHPTFKPFVFEGNAINRAGVRLVMRLSLAKTLVMRQRGGTPALGLLFNVFQCPLDENGKPVMVEKPVLDAEGKPVMVKKGGDQVPKTELVQAWRQFAPLQYRQYSGGLHIDTFNQKGELQEACIWGYNSRTERRDPPKYMGGFKPEMASVVFEASAEFLDTEDGIAFKAWSVTEAAEREANAGRDDNPGFSRILAVSSDHAATVRAGGSDAQTYKTIAEERRLNRELNGTRTSGAPGQNEAFAGFGF